MNPHPRIRRLLASVLSAALTTGVGIGIAPTLAHAAPDELLSGVLSLQAYSSGGFGSGSDTPTTVRVASERHSMPDGDAWTTVNGGTGDDDAGVSTSINLSAYPWDLGSLVLDPATMTIPVDFGVREVSGPGTFSGYRAEPGDSRTAQPLAGDGFRFGTGDGQAARVTAAVQFPATNIAFDDVVFRFSAEGAYCVTFEAGFHLAATGEPGLSTRQVGFLVGDATPSIDPCTSGTTDPEPVPVPEPEPGDSIATVYREGHADVLFPEITTGDDGDELVLRSRHDELGTQDYGDIVIWVPDGDSRVLPSPYSKNSDWSFLGDAGATVWTSPQGGAVGPWIGMATQSPTLDGIPYGSQFTYRLDAVTGQNGDAAPGEVALWQNLDSVPSSAGTILASTRIGLPAAWGYSKGSHTHMNWTFTNPGVYCLAFATQTDVPGAGRQEAQGLLTIAVGSSTDASQVTPCAQTDEYPEVDPRTAVPADSAVPAVIDTSRTALTVLPGSGANLDVVLDREDAFAAAAATRYGVDDVIVHRKAGVDYPYRVGKNTAYERDQVLTLSWDAASLSSEEFSGDVVWAVTEINGPGELTQASTGWKASGFDTAVDRVTQAVWPGSGTTFNTALWEFSRPGKYCVAMDWRAERADGTTATDSAVLTVVVDGPLDPGDFRQVRSGDIPVFEYDGEVWLAAEHGALDATCEQNPGSWTRASEVPIPDDAGEPGDETPAWDVPNWTETESGARILNLGHVDVASLVDGVALDTLIKDTTEEGIEHATELGASWHEPEDVVFQILPDSEVFVPSGEEYAFLGEPGTPIWQVSETQDFSLLWPGWSTEHIPAGVLAGGVEWTLTGAEGPGDFFLYTSGAGLNTTDVRFNTADGVDGADSFAIPVSAHVHGNWAFTAEGVYCLAFDRSAELADGDPVSDAFTLAVAVGETDPRRVDPGDCETSEPVLTVPTAPAAPTASVGSDTVTVSWSAPADGGSAITGYTVQLTGGRVPLVQDTTGDATTVMFADVPAGTYRASVIAVNAIGASAPSEPSEPVTVAAVIPDPDPSPDPTDPTDPDDPDPDPSPDPADPIPADPGLAETGVSPVPDAELTEGARGGVQVPEAAAAGGQVTVTVPGHAGEQVRVWLHSTPVLLGTVALDAAGRATVTIPASTAPGEHRIVVQALDGSLIGWDSIRIGTASQVGPDGEWLAATGAEIGWPAIGTATGLLLAGGLLLWARRRRTILEADER